MKGEKWRAEEKSVFGVIVIVIIIIIIITIAASLLRAAFSCKRTHADWPDKRVPQRITVLTLLDPKLEKLLTVNAELKLKLKTIWDSRIRQLLVLLAVKCLQFTLFISIITHEQPPTQQLPCIFYFLSFLFGSNYTCTVCSSIH